MQLCDRAIFRISFKAHHVSRQFLFLSNTYINIYTHRYRRKKKTYPNFKEIWLFLFRLKKKSLGFFSFVFRYLSEPQREWIMSSFTEFVVPGSSKTFKQPTTLSVVSDSICKDQEHRCFWKKLLFCLPGKFPWMHFNVKRLGTEMLYRDNT